jgi:hypothetical protein
LPYSCTQKDICCNCKSKKPLNTERRNCLSESWHSYFLDSLKFNQTRKMNKSWKKLTSKTLTLTIKLTAYASKKERSNCRSLQAWDFRLLFQLKGWQFYHSSSNGNMVPQWSSCSVEKIQWHQGRLKAKNCSKRAMTLK